MKTMKETSDSFCVLFLMLLVAQSVSAEIILSGDTSRPESNTFTQGEAVALTFAVNGVTPHDARLKLHVYIVDEHERLLESTDIPVEPNAQGGWQTTIPAPATRLGFYRVRATLSNGVTIPKLGSRAAGYLTYCVVPDPHTRKLYPETDTFFGMPGGFSQKVDIMPYLGIRWVLGGFHWDRMEPDRAGQIAETLAAQKKEPPSSWVTYSMPSLMFAPNWAVIPESRQYCTGILTPFGEKAWSAYCHAAARAFSAEHPSLPEHLYQITWEPVYPWGFKGTDEDLIRIYELAYPALHKADPNAVVLGPTGGAIKQNMEWNINLLKKGLGRYLDGFSIHPYIPLPPERAGLVEHIRTLRDAIRQHVGHDLPMFGTEQGYTTQEDPNKELDQARGLLRANLIMMGEGFKLNFAFFIADYPRHPGYGYFYNLNPKIPFRTDKIGPKPIAPGYAAQSFLLEGHHTAGPIEWLGETSLGYAFEHGDHVILALWDYGDQPHPVTLSVGVDAVEVYDWMGNLTRTATPSGTLSLSLGPEPVYIAGVSARLWGSRAEKPLNLKASRLIAYPGTQATVAGEVRSATVREVSVAIKADSRLGVPPFRQQLRVLPGKPTPFRLDVPVPATVALGAYPTQVTLYAGGEALAASGLMLRVMPPVTVRQVAPTSRGLAVELQDSQGEAQEGSLGVQLRGVPETRRRLPYKLAAGGRQRLEVLYDDLIVPPFARIDAVVTGTTSKGYRFEQSEPVDFLAAHRLPNPLTIDGNLTDWSGVSALALKGWAALVRSPESYHGAADLHAMVWLAWDDTALYLAVEVTDDTWLREHIDFDTSKGDCLQIGVDLDPLKQVEQTGNSLADAGVWHRASQIDLALTRKGPEAYRTITYDKDKLSVGLLNADEVQLAAVRTATGVTYEAALPWPSLGATELPAGDSLVGFAMTVNDLDHRDERDPKALGIFGGIVPISDPRQYGLLLLKGAR